MKSALVLMAIACNEFVQATNSSDGKNDISATVPMNSMTITIFFIFVL